MFTKLREPFGKAGLIVAVVALVFAMLGGAYAATNSGGGKATASAKAKQGKQGKPGKTGPAGPAGPAGPKGDPGAAGSNGSPGANGASVTGTPISGGACGTGVNGVAYSLSGTTTNVCNGKNGTTGFTKTLPSKETETGTWANGEYEGFGIVPITFAIPLAHSLFGGEAGGEEEPCSENPPAASCQVHYIDPAGKEVVGPGVEIENPPACPGSAAAPKALPGNLCVYAALLENSKPANAAIFNSGSGSTAFPGAGTTGAILFLSPSGGTKPNGWGTWAVTAE